MKLDQNVDWEMIPGEGTHWDIRLLTGDYTETVLRFTAIKISDDEEYMNFNFDVVSSPDPDLTDEDVKLQEYAGHVMSSILEEAAKVALANKNNKKVKG